MDDVESFTVADHTPMQSNCHRRKTKKSKINNAPPRNRKSFSHSTAAAASQLSQPLHSFICLWQIIP